MKMVFGLEIRGEAAMTASLSQTTGEKFMSHFKSLAAGIGLAALLSTNLSRVRAQEDFVFEEY